MSGGGHKKYGEGGMPPGRSESQGSKKLYGEKGYMG